MQIEHDVNQAPEEAKKMLADDDSPIAPHVAAYQLEGKFQAEIDAAVQTIVRAQRGLDYWKAVGVELEKQLLAIR